MMKGVFKYRFLPIVWLTGILFALQATAIAAPRGERQIEKEIHKLVNEYREQNGLPPLQYNDAVADIAQHHSTRMADKDIPFGHVAFQERYNILKKELPGMTSGAENVAYGADDAEAVVALWLRSASHKKNIRGNFTHTGIGVVQDSDGRLYFTQLFVKLQ